MRIIYITTHLPHGTDEAFIIPEITELRKLGHQILVVPRSPHGQIFHDRSLLQYSLRERLFAPRVLTKAMRTTLTRPASVVELLHTISKSRSTAVGIKNLAVLPKALWLADLAEQWKADHIHSHWGGTTSTMAMLASHLSRIPWSVTLHRWDIVESNLLTLKAKNASFMRFISNDGLKMALGFGAELRDTMSVIRMGVQMPVGTPCIRSASRQVVLCPARLVEVKGHRFLLNAWKLLKTRGVDGELWLAGPGELRSDLEQLATSLKITDSIKFLGALPHSQLQKLYEDGLVSAVALASIDMGDGLHEGVPVALIEAMSYGVPVVSTTTGAIRELVSTGTGLLVPPKDPGSLANALEALLGDPAFAKTIGEAGRRRVFEIHDIRVVATKLSDMFSAHGRRAIPQTPQYTSPEPVGIATSRSF